MSDRSSIEWTDATWNPIRGTIGRHHCVRISEGCRNCYAARDNHRFKGPDYVVGADTPRLDEKALEIPLHWKRPRKIFVCSMTDLFLDEHPKEFIDRVFAVMALARQHTFQILTKRPQRMRDYLRSADLADALATYYLERPERAAAAPLTVERASRLVWPLPNVWVGVSVENQPRANQRIPLLVETRAAVRFLSLEPLLENVHLRCGIYATRDGSFSGTTLDGIHWIIIGGESGPGARSLDVSWIRRLIAVAKHVGVACFVKQLGADVRDRNDAGFDGEHGDAWDIPDDWRVEYPAGALYQGGPVRVHLKDRKGGDPSEWPADLRVREFPPDRHRERGAVA